MHINCCYCYFYYYRQKVEGTTPSLGDQGSFQEGWDVGNLSPEDTEGQQGNGITKAGMWLLEPAKRSFELMDRDEGPKGPVRQGLCS